MKEITDGKPERKAKKTSVKSVAEKKLNSAASKYSRGSLSFNTSDIQHKALRKTLEQTKKRIQDAALRTATTEVLLPSDPGYIEVDGNQKVFALKQKDIVQNVDLNSAKNSIDLQLTNFGPYSVNYSNNGRCCRYINVYNYT